MDTTYTKFELYKGSIFILYSIVHIIRFILLIVLYTILQYYFGPTVNMGLFTCLNEYSDTNNIETKLTNVDSKTPTCKSIKP